VRVLSSLLLLVRQILDLTSASCPGQINTTQDDVLCYTPTCRRESMYSIVVDEQSKRCSVLLDAESALPVPFFILLLLVS
jgi:hypothetical protein